MPVIGYVSLRSADSDVLMVTEFRRGLNEAGYIEGKNVAIEFRWGGGQYDRLPVLMEDLVRRSVAIIVTSGGELAAVAAKAATTKIPIVFNLGEDPVRYGLVASISRPGGNATGVTSLLPLLGAKQLGLLRELVPKAVTIGMLTLYDKLNFNFIRDIAAVAGIVVYPDIMLVNPSVPAKTLAEFIAYAKANPGKLTVSSSGVGSPGHVSGELLKMMAGIDMLHVPYRGSPAALTDLLSGRIQVMFDNIPSSIEHIRAGKLLPLAVTTTARSVTLPDVPTLSDFIPGFEASAWGGIGAPRNTPAGVIDKLNIEINAALADAKMKARLTDLGGVVYPLSSADYGKRIVEETEKWATVVKFSGAKPD